MFYSRPWVPGLGTRRAKAECTCPVSHVAPGATVQDRKAHTIKVPTPSPPQCGGGATVLPTSHLLWGQLGHSDTHTHTYTRVCRGSACPSGPRSEAGSPGAASASFLERDQSPRAVPMGRALLRRWKGAGGCSEARPCVARLRASAGFLPLWCSSLRAEMGTTPSHSVGAATGLLHPRFHSFAANAAPHPCGPANSEARSPM